MASSPVTVADWRARVEKELGEKSFEKTLVHETPEGLRVEPLYTERPASLARDPVLQPFRVCMRHEVNAGLAPQEDLASGVEALWLAEFTPDAAAAKAFVVADVRDDATALRVAASGQTHLAVQFQYPASPAVIAKVALTAKVMASSVRYHEAGAEAVEEVGIALSSGVHVLRSLIEAGFSLQQAAKQVALQVSVGRDTFFEIAKLRALRLCWRKVLEASYPTTMDLRSNARAERAAVGQDLAQVMIHAVCSARTLTVNDPAVNMLRVTTQVFAAAVGGANLVTPNAFDLALGAPSALGRRVARNTGLVLRDESLIGRVADPAAGSYAIETLTDDVARKAWGRFQDLERDGGVEAVAKTGALTARIERAWHLRLAAIAKRKIPILGVSEFANLDEQKTTARLFRRDAEEFEALREAAHAAVRAEVALVAVGTFSQSRARVGFATGFFAAGGLRTSETALGARIACLCGSDDAYAREAVAAVKSLKLAGVSRVLLAGRPGDNEQALREAGVDAFIFVGCDVVETLSSLLGVTS